MIIFSVINHKGGVGKTTTAVNFAAAAAYLNKNVVLIDTDPQGSATSLFSVTELEKDFMNCFEDGAYAAGKSLFIPTNLPGLSIIGATSRISKQQIKVTPEAAEILREFCQNIPRADIVVFDCSPALTNLSKIILAASDEVIIPTTPTWFALEGIAKTLKTFQEAQELSQNELYINGVLLGKVNFYERFTKASREIRRKLKKPLYKTTIPDSKLIPKSEYESKTIFEEYPNSKIAESYLSLFREALERRQQRLRAQFETELYSKQKKDNIEEELSKTDKLVEELRENKGSKSQKKSKSDNTEVETDQQKTLAESNTDEITEIIAEKVEKKKTAKSKGKQKTKKTVVFDSVDEEQVEEAEKTQDADTDQESVDVEKSVDSEERRVEDVENKNE